MAINRFWGQSLHLDLHNCNKTKFRKAQLEKFCRLLCKETQMKQQGKAIVKRFGKGKLRGNSALQFITTSSLSVHTDNFLNRAFIDIFSCKKFDRNKVKLFSKEFFSAKKATSRCLNRF